MAILDKRIIKHHNKATTQWLIQWSNVSSADATWEFAFDIEQNFPETLPLEDKSVFKGKGLIHGE